MDAATLLGAVSACLLSLLAWIGSRIAGKVDAMSETLHSIETDLRGGLADLDRRVSVIEALNGKGKP